jgi:hypothetical protein
MISIERKPYKVVEHYSATVELDKTYDVVVEKIITEKDTSYSIELSGSINPLLSDIIQGYIDNQISKNLITI